MATSIREQESDWSALLNASRAGDNSAFCEICDRLTEYLLLTASSQLGGGLSAKLSATDIVQRTLLEAQQEFTNFRGTCENEFRTWLAKQLQQNIVDSTQRFRKSQLRNPSREVVFRMGDLANTLPGSQNMTGSVARQREIDDELLRAVAQLPAKRRRMIDLRHWQGLSFAEISKVLEITEAAARNLWWLAVDELRKKIVVEQSCYPRQPR